MNSVVILFITDVDELFYDILCVINPDWVERMQCLEESDVTIGIREKEEDSVKDCGLEEDGLEEVSHRRNLEDTITSLKTEMHVLHKTMDQLQEQNAELMRRFST